MFNIFQVSTHLTKLFDSLAKLKFRNPDSSEDKIANGMYSKDGEYVDLDKTCDCSGQVNFFHFLFIFQRFQIILEVFFFIRSMQKFSTFLCTNFDSYKIIKFGYQSIFLSDFLSLNTTFLTKLRIPLYMNNSGFDLMSEEFFNFLILSRPLIERDIAWSKINKKSEGVKSEEKAACRRTSCPSLMIIGYTIFITRGQVMSCNKISC